MWPWCLYAGRHTQMLLKSVGGQFVAWRGAEGRLLCAVRGQEEYATLRPRFLQAVGSTFSQLRASAEHHGKCSERTRGQDWIHGKTCGTRDVRVSECGEVSYASLQKGTSCKGQRPIVRSRRGVVWNVAGFRNGVLYRAIWKVSGAYTKTGLDLGSTGIYRHWRLADRILLMSRKARRIRINAWRCHGNPSFCFTRSMAFVFPDRCDPCQGRVNLLAKHVAPQPPGLWHGFPLPLLGRSASNGGRSSYW